MRYRSRGLERRAPGSGHVRWVEQGHPASATACAEWSKSVGGRRLVSVWGTLIDFGRTVTRRQDQPSSRSRCSSMPKWCPTSWSNVTRTRRANSSAVLTDQQIVARKSAIRSGLTPA